MVFAILVGLALAAVLIRLLENRFIFFPPRYPEGFSPPGQYGLRLDEVWMMTADHVKLNAWFLPDPSTQKALIWFHGNAENIGHGLEQMKTFTRLNVSVLALDYRGYGKSEGSPDEAGLYRDADAAYLYLVRERRFQPTGIFIYGHSLGGAIATDLAARRQCGGLIVESSFSSGRDMARRMFRLPFFEYVPRSQFDSHTKIRRVRAPVLIVHGTKDEVIPFAMGEELYRAASEPKSFFPVEGAGHDTVFTTGGERYQEALRSFIHGR